jgi:hypothetical protein
MLDAFGLKAANDDFRAGDFHVNSLFKTLGARPPVPPQSFRIAATQTLQRGLSG